MPAAPYSAAIATFRRPESLAEVLRGLREQEHPPSLVVVADNDPERSAEVTASGIDASAPYELVYLPIGANLGPAGGWARGVELASSSSRRGEWVAVLDDDDPIPHPSVMRRLGEHAAAAAADVAAVGLRGARLRSWSATLHRVEPVGRAGFSEVDYLASGGAPLYRWSAIDQVGFFDPELFFGFEDLELGIRMRRRGLRLLVVDVGGIHVVADTSPERTPWREYYKTRALTAICRRHLGRTALALTLVRSLALGGLRLVVVERDLRLVSARWQGARDGLVGSLGPGSWAPSSNPSKRGVET